MTETVRSAARVLDLVEFLATAEGGASLSEATGGLAAPKSSTLMLLRTLVQRGYAYRDTTSDRYHLSDHFRSGAFGWVADPLSRLAALGRPVMEALSEAIGETCTLGVMSEDHHARHLTKVVANLDVRYDTDVTRPIPLYCTAIGRTLLAHRSSDARAALLGAGPFKALTPYTLTERGRILALLEDIQRDGFAIVMEEFALGGTGVAAPVFDATGGVVAALNAGCVTNRFQEKREQVISAVRRHAALLSLSLGAPAVR
jgi:IclR family pca regulon transcriptional regulator